MEKRYFHKRLLWLIILLYTCGPEYAQPANQDLVDHFSVYYRTRYQERIFVHLDRNYYLTGERIWFTIYCLENGTGKPSRASSVAYIELMDRQGRAIQQQKIELRDGTGEGFFQIPPTCNSEAHVIRCYTTWQRNFGPDQFSYHPVLIIHPSKPYRDIPMDADHKGVVLDFYPEGGSLIRGVPNRIVFTAFDSHYHPLECTGEIISSDSVVHDSLATLQPGIGVFRLVPEPGKNYFLRITGDGPEPSTHPIPQADAYGCALELLPTGKSSWMAIIRPDTTWLNQNQELTALIWNERGIHRMENLRTDRSMHFPFGEAHVAPGINYMTVVDQQHRLVAERMFLGPEAPPLQITATGLKSAYDARDTVAFTLETSVSNRLRFPARLSLSVSGEGTYLSNSVTNSFRSQMQLAGCMSKLFAVAGNTVSDTLLDLWMIIHSAGNSLWLHEDPPSMPYVPEREGLLVSGTIQHPVTGEPIRGQSLMLSFVDSVPDIYTATSDDKGRFRISLNHLYGKKDMIVQPYGRENGLLISLEDDYSKDPLPPGIFALLKRENLAGLYEALLLNQQLEKAYNLDLPDIDPEPDPLYAFYGIHDHQIVMDEFIKLPVMEEVFRELGKRVFLLRGEEGYQAALLDLHTNRIIGGHPLYLLDGIPFFDAGLLLNLDPSAIHTIRLKSEKYFMSHISMDGIIDIRTRKGLGDLMELPRAAIRTCYQGFQPEGVCFPGKGTIPEDPNIPYFTTTLFYDHIRISSTGDGNRISFIAPDSKGAYELIIKALGEDGSLGEKNLSFTVN